MLNVVGTSNQLINLEVNRARMRPDDSPFLATNMRPSWLSLVSSTSKLSTPSSRPLVHEKGYGEPLAQEVDVVG